MSSDAALDSFSVMIDVDSDVSSFATGLDEDAGGDNAPLAAAEEPNSDRQAHGAAQAQLTRALEPLSRQIAIGVIAAEEAQKACGIGCRVQQHITTTDQGIGTAEIFGPAVQGGDDISEMTQSSLLGHDVMSVSIGTAKSGFFSKKNASTQTPATLSFEQKKNASTQTELFPPETTTERAVRTPTLRKQKPKSSIRNPRRCRTCGMDAFFNCWREFHPCSRKVKGHFVECRTPESKRVDGFPYPRDKRLPPRSQQIDLLKNRHVFLAGAESLEACDITIDSMGASVEGLLNVGGNPHINEVTFTSIYN